jgi:hypothetical protein
MLELQRRIAEDERKKRMSQQPSAPGSPVVIGPSSVPIHQAPSTTYVPSNTATFDLPLPSGPIGGIPSEDTHDRRPSSNHGGCGADNGPRPGHRDEDDEIRPGEIDPRLCKKDPKTQAAAAKLTMGECARDAEAGGFPCSFTTISHDALDGYALCDDDGILGQSQRPIWTNQGHGCGALRFDC